MVFLEVFFGPGAGTLERKNTISDTSNFTSNCTSNFTSKFQSPGHARTGGNRHTVPGSPVSPRPARTPRGAHF